jgi:hypothetical protein
MGHCSGTFRYGFTQAGPSLSPPFAPVLLLSVLFHFSASLPTLFHSLLSPVISHCLSPIRCSSSLRPSSRNVFISPVSPHFHVCISSLFPPFPATLAYLVSPFLLSFIFSAQSVSDLRSPLSLFPNSSSFSLSISLVSQSFGNGILFSWPSSPYRSLVTTMTSLNRHTTPPPPRAGPLMSNARAPLSSLTQFAHSRPRATQDPFRKMEPRHKIGMPLIEEQSHSRSQQDHSHNEPVNASSDSSALG